MYVKDLEKIVGVFFGTILGTYPYKLIYNLKTQIMNSINFKAILLGASCFAFASTFAQDTPKTPKPDTTNMPKHDSTSMNLNSMHNNNSVSLHIAASDSFIMKNESIVAIKNEADNETPAEKYLAKTSA